MAGGARGLMLSLATVDPKHEAEFNRWYEEEHLPDVRRRFPQIVSARRYRAVDGQEPRHIVVYERELQVDDVLYKELSIRGVLSIEKVHTYSLPLEQAEDAMLAGHGPGVNPIHLAIVPGALPVSVRRGGGRSRPARRRSGRRALTRPRSARA
ncbi:MAG TPA: hypothetical protein VGV13_08675 [Methylomirabilota bacterium]|jgi:hypothetical protein|nr:hypothetical protein [Methylomirabilota bacterium]